MGVIVMYEQFIARK